MGPCSKTSDQTNGCPHVLVSKLLGAKLLLVFDNFVKPNGRQPHLVTRKMTTSSVKPNQTVCDSQSQLVIFETWSCLSTNYHALSLTNMNYHEQYHSSFSWIVDDSLMSLQTIIDYHALFDRGFKGISRWTQPQSPDFLEFQTAWCPKALPWL